MWQQGPLDLLALLRGEEDFLMDLADEDVEDEVIFHALEWATEAHIIFAKAMRDITHATSMGDVYGGPSVMSPTMYRKYGLPYEKKVVEAAAVRGGCLVKFIVNQEVSSSLICMPHGDGQEYPVCVCVCLCVCTPTWWKRT